MEIEFTKLDILRAIATITSSRITHAEWRDWLIKNPNDPRVKTVGDFRFHERCVKEYDLVLSILKKLQGESMERISGDAFQNDLIEGIRQGKIRLIGREDYTNPDGQKMAKIYLEIDD